MDPSPEAAQRLDALRRHLASSAAGATPLQCHPSASPVAAAASTAAAGDTTAAVPASQAAAAFEFNAENFQDPHLPAGLRVLDVPLVLATDEALKPFGRLVHAPDEFTTAKGTFEIRRWPQPGWRPLDPGTGDEAGTVEGDFEVRWNGDFFLGHNLAIASTNNKYLDGLGAVPERASRTVPAGDGKHILLWMSDYHPDGAQLFWPREPTPFVVCLGPASVGDDVTPADMRAFYVPAGKGVYFHPGTWHNGVYIARDGDGVRARRFLTRQGRVHARVSASWANEHGVLLRVPLTADKVEGMKDSREAGRRRR